MEHSADITFRLGSPFLERLEQLAQLSGKTVAEIVEIYIKVQLGWRPDSPYPMSPEVAALQGSVPLPPGLDYKATLGEELTKKYGR
jgi:hypothetical protein